MSILTTKTARFLLVFLATAAGIWLLYLVREIFLTFFLAALVAYICYRPVRFIEKKGVGRVGAILLFYSLFISFIGLVLWVSIPIMIKEIGDLARLIPQYALQAQGLADSLQTSPMSQKVGVMVGENLARVEKTVYGSLQNFINSLHIFLGRMIAIVFSPILAFYILHDWEKIRDNFLDLFTPGGRRDAVLLFSKIDQVLMEFLKGNLLVAVLVGGMTGLTAALLGVRLPLLIGLGATLAEFIPFFGAFLGAIPALIIAFSQSLKIGIYMLLAVLIIQQLEGNIISPKIIGARLGMHPLLMVFALLAGGELFGIWGLLLAVPLVAVMRVLAAWVFEKAISTHHESNNKIY